MSPKTFVFVAALVVAAHVLASDRASAIPGASTRDSSIDLYPANPSSVQVTVAAAAPETWQGATAGTSVELAENKVTDKTGRMTTSLVPGRRKLARTTLRGLIEGTNVAGFDTDLATNVRRIVIEPTLFDVIEAKNADGSVTFLPGQVRMTNATFTFSPVSRPLADWVRSITDGTSVTRRDVTVSINGIDPKTGKTSPARTLVMRRCLPTAYTSNGTTAVIKIRSETIEVKAQDHVSTWEWVNTNLNGAGIRRDVKVQFAGTLVQQKNAIVAEIGWGELDKGASGRVEEWVSLQPASTDTLP